jgi:hypothetical protein
MYNYLLACMCVCVLDDGPPDDSVVDISVDESGPPDDDTNFDDGPPDDDMDDDGPPDGE